jgi:adenylate cyclase
MGIEVERKFAVAKLPEFEVPGARLRQGYVTRGSGTEVRLRQADAVHTITVKTGSGLVRGETEVELTAAQFEALWPTTEGARLEKTRHTLDRDGHTYFVDVYDGGLAGLLTVEVEFPDAGAAAAFVPPDWFGTELTGRSEYGNRSLAVDGLPADGPNG